jgi:hypothetical protein
VKRPSVGVAITTHNRPDVLAAALQAWRRHSPHIPLIVVDDGSEPPAIVPAGVTLIRHDTARGIPQAKNRCLAALMELGVEHLFLADNDVYPTHPDWWQHYVASPEPHLQFSWTHSHGGEPVPGMDVVYADPDLVAYGWSMGCLLYVTAGVVHRVGGMRPEFGLGMNEHIEYSQRIHNAGLSTFVHQNVPDRNTIWACDRYGAVPRTLPVESRKALLARNEKLRIALAEDDSFVPYTGHRDSVLTVYFTGGDPQRGGSRLPADGSALADLTTSLAVHDLSPVVLTDLTRLPGGVTVRVGTNPYLQRWIGYRQYLQAHPEVRYVWCVDGTDVRMLNNPFPEMRPGTLYCGWEAETVGCRWMREHAVNYGDWVTEHGQEMLLNAGVVGGDRQTIIRLCQNIIELWAASDKFDPLEEMTLFNIAARRHREVVTGIQVTTLFKSFASNHPTSWWAHK